MCGIIGYYSKFPSRYERELWVSARKYKFRGPDETTQYNCDGFSAIFNRLSIVSKNNGSQPLADESGSVISFANAEIYNYQELITRHPDFFYQNDSDCAIIPALYHYYGNQFAEQLEGMFSIVIYDKVRNEISLIRDPLGIKPLFYSVDDKGDFFFSSEAKGILPFIHEEIIDCAEMLNDPWLRGDVGYDSLKYRNVFSQVKTVPPGSMLKYNTSTGHIEIIRYNSHMPESIVSLTTPEFFISEFSKAFDASCRQQLSPSGRTGILLSGGIDSIGVLAALKDANVVAYTLMSPGTEESGDASGAIAAAEKFGVPLHKVYVDSQITVSTKDWKTLLWASESPYFGAEQIYKACIYSYIKQHTPDVCVVLSGNGSDELFGGYTQSFVFDENEPWQSVEESLRYLKEKYDLESPGCMNLKAWQELSDYKLFDSAFVSAKSLLGSEDYWSFYQKVKLRDLHDYNLHNEDRISSLFSIENRVPFLSNSLIKLSMSIPDSLRETLLLDKEIVRRGLQPTVGESFARRKKVPFFHGESSGFTLGMLYRSLSYDDFYLVHEACNAIVGGERFLEPEGMIAQIQSFYEDADLIGMINLSRLINVGLLNQLLKEDIELNGFVFAPT
ncbi:asparagine synthetase B family protein [Serratia nematodiphila]|uniref:asparagine synthetase B family protein n=1 Tax=Serratia nematodiphila TaxID=458197 RepID=UPI0011DA0F70|nr:asparagine synthetase B [Serratia nematodiphila]TXE59880.1 asparagine synthetase B [Serratia nematodiphila]